MSLCDSSSPIAIVGAGMIGTSWATVFVRAGFDVAMFDADAAQRERAPERVAANLALMRDAGVIADDLSFGSISVCDTLEDAVAGAAYVQESVLETLEAKIAVARDLDQLIGATAIVGSSSSGIPASAFTAELANRERFYIVHPVNPPHLIPVVEIVPAPWSDQQQIGNIRALMEEIGQEPMLVKREIEGFVLNRLQGALLNEAWALLSEGYASADDIDRTVRAGLGLRWSLIGPFETIDLNAPGGIGDYAERFAPLYERLAQSRTQPEPWSKEAVQQAVDELREIRGQAGRSERERQRDAWLLQLARLKRDSSF